MKVPYREDLASHSGPEPHGGCGNTAADAWTRRGDRQKIANPLTTLRHAS